MDRPEGDSVSHSSNHHISQPGVVSGVVHGSAMKIVPTGEVFLWTEDIKAQLNKDFQMKIMLNLMFPLSS